jgi:RNA ligase
MFDRERLDSMVSDGWLKSQRHPDADLWIYNYTEKTQFEKHWTPETLACRGLILDGDGAVVARPFPKFFNHGDPQVGELPMEPFTVREKIDGSLGIAYWLPGEIDPCIATRGSFTSEQAIEGTRMIQGRELDWEEGITPLFEIVYPENRIVVDYGDRRDLIFLAALDNRTGREVGFPEWIWERAEVHNEPSLTSLVGRGDRLNAEGYVVTFESGLRVKIKHAEYVRLHKLITGVNARHIWEILKEGGDLASMLDGIPDELHEWISGVEGDLRAAYQREHHCAATAFNHRPVGDRKEIAAYFKASDANPAILFRWLDDKTADDLIWKAIKPEPTTPDTIWTRDAEAVA